MRTTHLPDDAEPPGGVEDEDLVRAFGVVRANHLGRSHQELLQRRCVRPYEHPCLSYYAYVRTYHTSYRSTGWMKLSRDSESHFSPPTNISYTVNN